jgi:hypothetical protein
MKAEIMAPAPFTRSIAEADGLFLLVCTHSVLDAFQKNRPIDTDSR